jgi:hypothetical protein
MVAEKFSPTEIFESLYEQQRKRSKKKPLRQFAIADEALLGKLVFTQKNRKGEEYQYDVYRKYSDARATFASSLNVLNELSDILHDLLDIHLRDAGLLTPEDLSWSHKESDEGLIIQTWPTPKKRGRQKAPVEMKELKIVEGKVPTELPRRKGLSPQALDFTESGLILHPVTYLMNGVDEDEARDEAVQKVRARRKPQA